MKIGNLLVNAAYLGSKVLTAMAVGATKVWEAVSKYIKFKDPVVEQLCMKWSSDGIGLTPEDAAKVTSIGTVFRGNTEITSFEELEIFSSVKVLVDNAFRDCAALESVDITNITTINSRAFSGCASLRHLGDTSAVKDIVGANALQDTTQLRVQVNFPSLAKIGSSGIFISSGITGIVSLGTVEAIPIATFRSCTNLVKANLPTSVISIGSSAFADCTSLADVNFSELTRLTTISESAFKRLVMPIVDLPQSVTFIGNEAFRFAKTEKFIFRSYSPPQLNSLAFNGTPSTMSIYVPDESVDAYKSATNWSAYADRIKPMSEYVEPTNNE